MATKMIKFDLSMKGVKVTSFEELQEQFSADILPIFQTGRLAKWLMSRDLVAQAEAIVAIDKNSTELQQLAAISRVLELDDDVDVLQFLLDDRQAAQTTSLPPIETETDVDPDTEVEVDTKIESNNVQPIESKVVILETKKESLESMLNEYESDFRRARDCGLYFGSDLLDDNARKKVEGAERSYANRGKGGLILLYDSTIFGSGKEGFYLTNEEFSIKFLFEDRYVVRIRDIRRFRVDRSDCEFTINGTSFTYALKSLRDSLIIISKCIEKYNKQFS